MSTSSATAATRPTSTTTGNRCRRGYRGSNSCLRRFVSGPVGRGGVHPPAHLVGIAFPPASVSAPSYHHRRGSVACGLVAANGDSRCGVTVSGDDGGDTRVDLEQTPARVICRVDRLPGTVPEIPATRHRLRLPDRGVQTGLPRVYPRRTDGFPMNPGEISGGADPPRISQAKELRGTATTVCGITGVDGTHRSRVPASHGL